VDEPTVAVLGLPGFRLLEVNGLDGELEYLVETTDKRPRSAVGGHMTALPRASSLVTGGGEVW
jgi:hypothetical protein